MGELRRDPIMGRWVIVSSNGERKPEDFEIEPHVKKGGMCPFCSGNEDKTPPEIEAVRDPGTGANKPGWSIRVVPNKFPALGIEGGLNKAGLGVFDQMSGIGAHEVIIETTEHNKSMSDLTEAELEKVIQVFCNRSLDLIKDKRFKYLLIFKNYGEAAGASLEHEHSQLIALPIVPKRVNEELAGTEKYFQYRERCVFCDMIQEEMDDGKRIICENKGFMTFAPFASSFPFETWVIPKEHNAFFYHINKEQVQDMARILRETLLRIKKLLHDPSFNFIIHTAPHENKEGAEHYHWHLEMVPRLTKVAGFEWGSGFYINPVSPESAAKYLREVKI